MINYFLTIGLVFGVAGIGKAEDVVRIQPGKNSSTYTNTELKERVHTLEKAVQQLQEKMFDVESEQQVAKAKRMEKEKWTCNLQVQMRNYTSIEQTKSEAKKAVIAKCADGEGRAFYCKKPKCYN